MAKKIYGIIGYPVKHSLSPAMHNAAFRALGIDAEYKLFEVKPEELNSFLDSLAEKNIYGLNVTIPHKVRVKEILEKEFPYDKDALLVGHQDSYYVKWSGAVNTINRREDKLEYYNTDANGFLESLKADLEFIPKDKKVLLLGCGGAGRAIIAGLSWVQVGILRIYTSDINAETLNSAKEHFSHGPEYLRSRLEFISEEQIIDKIKDVDLLVNASPVGMKVGDKSLVDKELLREGKKSLCVYDAVYNRETQLVKDAKELLGDSRAVGGLGMLLHQGMRSFKIWTGKPAPKEVMQKALSEALK